MHDIQPRLSDRQLAEWADQNAARLGPTRLGKVMRFMDSYDIVYGVWLGRGELRKHLIKGQVQLQRVASEGVGDRLSATAIRVSHSAEAVALEEVYSDWLLGWRPGGEA